MEHHMSILGIESLGFHVDNIEESARFFDDLGLTRAPDATADEVRFALAEGSSVILRKATEPHSPGAPSQPSGSTELIWGVDDRRTLDAIADDLSRDRAVAHANDGTI